MAHEVESMMYVREVPWHGLGVKVNEALTSAEAIKTAGLDWEVHGRPIFTDSGIQIPGYVANTRTSDNSILGVVTEKYKIVQNKDAFAFTDNLIGPDCRYETAGSLKNGRSVWMLAKLPRTQILDDDVDQYLCFSNTHDGTGAVRVVATNVRVVCNNTLNIALNSAQRSWSCKHMGNISNKLDEAAHCLKLANKYNSELAKYADRAAHIKIDEEKTYAAIAELFPITTEMNSRAQQNMKDLRNQFETCLYAVDLSQFYGTIWGIVNAASDFAYHRTPQRMTNTIQENRMKSVLNGNAFLDKVVDMFAIDMN